MPGLISSTTAIPTGTVVATASTSQPSGWLMCDGRRVSRTTYAALFAAIGTAHGVGDGSTTFNLPDYRWTFLRGGSLGSAGITGGSGTASSNQATFTAHGFNRSGVRVRLTSGTLSGLSAGTDYYVIYVDDNTLAFATSHQNAILNTRVSISGSNSATITQWEDPDGGSRTGPGGTGAAIGARQDEQFSSHNHGGGSHTHGLTAMQVGGVANVQGGSGIAHLSQSITTGGPSATVVQTQGGNETRPRNVSVYYLIKT